MEDFISGKEESEGNEDYVDSATEMCNIFIKLTVSLTLPQNDNMCDDLADGARWKSFTGSNNTHCGITGAQPHELRSGRKYGPNKSTPINEITSKESSSRGRESANLTRVEISSAVDSGSDEHRRLSKWSFARHPR